MTKTIKLATVFSGIGAIEQAFIKSKKDYKIIFACDNGERTINKTPNEIFEEFSMQTKTNDLNSFVKDVYNTTKKENFVKKSYFANYKIKEDQWYEDIRFIKGDKFFNNIDLLVGGSPCQSFSVIGKRLGLEDTRGTLFYDFARLINETKPKVFIYENVSGMLNHDKGKTWKTILDVFESLNYKIYYKLIDASDFNIPQRRKRLYVVGFLSKNINFSFPEPLPLIHGVSYYLEKSADPKYFLGKKGFEFVTNEKYKNRARINREIIQTEKANQQYNWNGDFVFLPLSKIKNKSILEKAYIGKFNGEDGVIRKMTNRECLRLMGFQDSFKIVVPDMIAYRQAGNSIVVNVLENILNEIFKTGAFNGKN